MCPCCQCVFAAMAEQNSAATSDLDLLRQQLWGSTPRIDTRKSAADALAQMAGGSAPVPARQQSRQKVQQRTTAPAQSEIGGPDDLVILGEPAARGVTQDVSRQNAEEPWLNLQLALGWVINIVSWILFVATGSHIIEFMTAVANLGAAYLGLRNRSSWLVLISVGDAAWMFAWSLGVFGDSAGILSLVRRLQGM